MQSEKDRFGHRLFILENVVVPESQNPKALGFQISVTARIASAFGMMAAIGLDDQSPSETGKVHDVKIDGQLAFELEAGEALGAEDLP